MGVCRCTARNPIFGGFPACQTHKRGPEWAGISLVASMATGAVRGHFLPTPGVCRGYPPGTPGIPGGAKKCIFVRYLITLPVGTKLGTFFRPLFSPRWDKTPVGHFWTPHIITVHGVMVRYIRETTHIIGGMVCHATAMYGTTSHRWWYTIDRSMQSTRGAQHRMRCRANGWVPRASRPWRVAFGTPAP